MLMKEINLKKWFLIFTIFFTLSNVNSQTWRSSLYPSNWTPPTSKNFYTDAFIQDFSYAGYRSGEVEIPTISSNVINVTAAPYNADKTGGTDATAIIQSVIDKVQNDGGGVVYLPAGTYKLSAGTRDYCLRINKSNVVLRGAGVGQTYLYNDDNNMRFKDIITVEGSGGNWKAQPATVATITSDLNGPTMVIPVNSTSMFAVGDQVVLRQALTASWANEHQEPEWATGTYPASLGGVINFRIIKAINATAKTITIDAPTRYAFKMRDGACVYKSPSTMIEEVGLEDFSIGNREVVTNFNDWVETGSTTELFNEAEKTATKGAYDCHASYVVGFNKVLNSWMKNVSTYSPSVNQFKTQMLSNGVKLELSRGITIDNVDLGYAQYGGGGGNGYGFRIESNDCLIKNSKAEYVRHGFVFSFMHSSGNVLYNDICKKSGKCTGNAPNGLNTGSSGSDFHMWFSPSNLIDNMTFDESYFSAVHRKAVASDHNAVTAHSVFWNTTGTNARSSIVIRSSQTRFGYIMGTKGNTPAVEVSGANAFRYDIGGTRSSPEDMVEGVNNGANLQPQSLYLDQLSKRLVEKSNQTITFPSIAAKNVGDADFAPGATSSSGLVVSYSSSNTAVATIVGGNIRIIGAGTSVITASQAGNTIYNAAANVTQTLTVNKLAQTISFPAIAAKNVGDADFAPGATASSGLAVSYTSSNTAVATIVSGNIRIIGAGTAVIAASQTGDATYNAATDAIQTLTVNEVLVPPTVAFEIPTGNISLDYGYTAFRVTVGATATNGTIAKVELYVDDVFLRQEISGPYDWGFTAFPSELLGLSVGSHTIKAIAIDSNGLSASASIIVQVNKLTQTITFPAIATKNVGDTDFAPGASASSGLVISYSSSNTAVATIVSGNIRIVGAGTTVITASQAGNVTYNAATNITQTLTVNKLAQTINFPAIVAKNVGDADFAPGATASSGLAVSYASSNTAVATIVSGNIRIIGAGTSVITASQAGNVTYNSAANITQTLTITSVNSAPVVSFTTPTANASVNQGYTSFNVLVNATDAGGSITDVKLYINNVLIRSESVAPYEWGHAAFPNELLGLAVGNHTFKAVATDNSGQTSEDTFVLTVNSNVITRFIEAESFTTKTSTIAVIASTDTGGGQVLGSINNGNFANFSVSIPTAGTFTTKFRVSAPAGKGGSIEMYLGTTKIGTATISPTGGWDTYVTVTGPSIVLAAGTQTIQLKFVNGSASSNLMNINWFEISNGSTTSRVGKKDVALESVTHLQVYPNPVEKGRFLTISSADKDKSIAIFDLIGRLVYTKEISGVQTTTITTDDFKAGVYIIKVNTELSKFIVK